MNLGAQAAYGDGLVCIGAAQALAAYRAAGTSPLRCGAQSPVAGGTAQEIRVLVLPKAPSNILTG
jgi:hypothetical protein